MEQRMVETEWYEPLYSGEKLFINPQKSTILVDLDGCVCAYRFDEIVKQYFGVDIPDIYAYDLADVLGVSNDDIDKMFLEQVCGKPNFIEDALETLNEWSLKDYHIYIYSNRVKYMGSFGLVQWLDENRIPFVDIIETVDKTYDFHIDDCPAKLMNANAKHKLLFSQSWNERCFDVKKALTRVENWKEIREIIS